MNTRLSYSITSLTSPEVNDAFLKAKIAFNSFFNDNKLSNPNHFILKNMAHVTLKSSFYLRPGIRDEEVSRALSSITFSPISITASRIEQFTTRQHGNVLVLIVDKTPELQQLHTDLYELLITGSEITESHFEKENYNPHLSILYGVRDEQLGEVNAYIREHILPISYTLTSFMFMREVPGVKGERELLAEYSSAKQLSF